MNLFNSQNHSNSISQLAKIVGGFLLIISGIVGAILITNQMILFIKSPQDIALITKFMEFSSQARTIVLQNGNIELPEILNFIIGFIVYLWILGMGISLVKLLITSGVTLLQNEVEEILKELHNEILRLKGQEKSE